MPSNLCHLDALTRFCSVGKRVDCWCAWPLQDTQQGDIMLALTWTSIQLDAESDIKAEPTEDNNEE